jgi:hypothetical protein
VAGIADQSADWKAVLESGGYPHATFPLSRLTFRMPAAHAGETCRLVTLLAATRDPEPAYRVREEGTGIIRVEALREGFPEAGGTDGDLSVRADARSLQIRMDGLPGIPEALSAFRCE